MNFLAPYIGAQWYSAVISVALMLAAVYLAGRVLRLLLKFIESRLASRTKNTLDNLLLDTIASYIAPTLVLLSLYVIIKQFRHEYSGVTGWVKTAFEWAVAVSYVVNAAFIGYVFVRFIRTAVNWYIETVAAKTQTHLDDELAPLVKRLLNLIVFLLVAIVILDHFHQNLSTIIVSLGVGSLAIALAAQDTLANTIAGFVLMIDRPFRLGDRVKLTDGTLGNVQDIGIRSTKLVNDDHIMFIIPNAEIVKSQIQNLSYPNDIVRFRVSFDVAYGTNIDILNGIVMEAVNREPDIVEPKTTEVRVVELANSSLKMDVLCKINNPNNIPRRRSDLLKIIYETLNANNIEIPFPQRVVHLRSPNQAAPGAGAGDAFPGHE